MRSGRIKNQALINEVRRLAEDKKLSAGEIAKELTSSKNEVTRNRVIGLANRHGIKLDSRTERKVIVPAQLQTQLVPTQPVPTQPVPTQPVPDGGILLFDLADHHCRWVLGNGNFCGADKRAEGGSYCDQHSSIVYVVPPRLRSARSRRVG